MENYYGYLLEIWTVLYFQYKSLLNEVLEYLSLWEQFSILPDKVYSIPLTKCNIKSLGDDTVPRNKTWTVSSSMGSSHFTDITCPWGSGGVTK